MNKQENTSSTIFTDAKCTFAMCNSDDGNGEHKYFKNNL